MGDCEEFRQKSPKIPRNDVTKEDDKKTFLGPFFLLLSLCKYSISPVALLYPCVTTEKPPTKI
jgi:hypothetical protein